VVPARVTRRAAPAARPGNAAATALALALPPVVTFAVMLWGITGPSYWRDESATLSAVGRPFGQLIRMLGNYDAVHGAYYALIWVVTRLAGTGELATRLPSALAMAGAALGVAAIGKRVVSPLAGLASGLLFAAMPLISWYGQDARSYALVVAMATAASYLLVRVIQSGAAWRAWLAGYGGCLALLAVVNAFGLLLAVAHAVTVAIVCLRRRGTAPGGAAGSQPSAAALAVGWLAAVLAAVAVTSPLLALVYAQRGQVSWIRLRPATVVQNLRMLIGPWPMVLAVAVIVLAGLGIAAAAGGRGFASRWPAPVGALCVPWLVVPPVTLLAVSAVKPLWEVRYILICIPAICLLAGTALAALGRVPVLAGLLAVALLGLPAQHAARAPDGHGDNIRAADRIVEANYRPGDAVLYSKKTTFPAAYPYGLARLRDIAVARSPVASATLTGTFLPPAQVQRRLAAVSRLWIVEWGRHRRMPVRPGPRFRLERRWRVSDIRLFLFVRR
jgi:mannosyltransferase